MPPITLTQKQDNGLVEFECPICRYPIQLPSADYDYKIQDGKITVTKKAPAEKENPFRIDLRKKDGHSVNCDFTLIDAPIVIYNEPPKPALAADN